MHPHLPLPLTVWLMAVAVFGSFSAQTQAAESISINFGSGSSSIAGENSTGLESVAGSNWNQFSNASQSTAQTLIDQNGASTNSTITWTSANIYQYGTASTGTSQMMYGYLDDGSGISVNVSNLEFLTYGVYIYCNTDTTGASFSSKTVNGVSYTWDSNTSSIVQGTSYWGSQGTVDSLALGTNALYVDGLTSPTLIISSSRADTSSVKVRGCISGIQIVDTYTGTKQTASLSGDSTWTSTQLGSASWTDSTADAGTYASVSGSGTLVIADGETRTTDGIILTEGGDLTISGGTLALIGPGALRTAEGASLTIASDVTGSVSLLGDITLSGNKTLTGLSGAGTLTLSDNTTITISGDTATTYTGSLALGDNSSITANANWTFNGSLSIDVSKYSTVSSWANSAKELTLTGTGTTTFTTTGNLNGGTLNINDGVTVEVNRGSESAGVLQNTTVNVAAGGTFKSSGHDALGWGGGHTAKIVLTGEAGKYATFLNNEDGTGSNTLMTDIVMNGHAKVTGTKINTFGGTITASGTDNVIDSELQFRSAVTMTVNQGGELTLAGKLNNDQSSSGTNRITKAGAGTLIVASTDYSSYNDASGGWNINAGTLKVAQNAGVGVVGVTVASGATLDVASGGHVGNALNLSNGSTLKLTTDGFVLDNGSLTLGTGLTLNITTGDTMLLSALGLDDQYSYTLASGVSSISGDWAQTDASNYFSTIMVDGEALSLDNAMLFYDNTAQTLTLASIPEPATATLSLLALGALVLRRRRV